MNEPVQLDDKMFHELMEEIRHIRRRLDTHVDEEAGQLVKVAQDITKIKEEMAGHRTKLGIASAAIAVVFSALVAWIASHIGMPE